MIGIRILAAAAALVALAACGKKTSEPAAERSETDEAAVGIDVAGIDKAIDPGDDFYAYANGAWRRSFELPDGYASYGAVTAMAERTQARLKALVEDPELLRAPPGSPERLVGDYHASRIDLAGIDAKGLAPLAEDFAAIDSLATNEAAAVALFDPGLAAASPIVASVRRDAKRPDRYAVYISQAGLGPLGRDYYLEDKFKAERARYRDYAAAMLGLAGVAGASGAADRLLAFETELARAQWEEAKRGNRDLSYNLKTIGQLEAFAPSAPWRKMLAAAGLANAEEAILEEDDAVAAMADTIAAAPIGTLRDSLKFHLIDAYAEILPGPFRNAHSAYLGGPVSRAGAAETAANAALAPAVGAIYVKRHFAPPARRKADALLRELRAALVRRIDKAAWMDESTRAKAKEKLARLALKIGDAGGSQNYAGLDIRADDAFGNARRAREFAWRAEVARLGRPFRPGDPEIAPYAIDLRYDPARNEIAVPAALFDAPLFDASADDAANFGAIGAVIGHELWHVIDDGGRRSDGGGALIDWWSDESAAKYEARANSLIEAYRAIAAADAAHDDERARREIVADAAGLALAFDAYAASLRGETAPVLGGLTGEQRFFLAFAQASRRAVRPSRSKEELANDPHPPTELRVNGAVRTFNPWYEAFDVGEGDELWLDAASRLAFW